jgi:hypothetical protein
VLGEHASGVLVRLGVFNTAVAWLVGLLLIISTVLLGYALLHVRASSPRAGGPTGAHRWGAPSRDLLWVAVPLVILAIIFLVSLRG